MAEVRHAGLQAPGEIEGTNQSGAACRHALHYPEFLTGFFMGRDYGGDGGFSSVRNGWWLPSMAGRSLKETRRSPKILDRVW
jgi:hypothetical protein